jgi:hypothetical protein
MISQAKATVPAGPLTCGKVCLPLKAQTESIILRLHLQLVLHSISKVWIIRQNGLNIPTLPAPLSPSTPLLSSTQQAFKLKQNSVEPNKPSLNHVQYSIPAVRFPDNTYVMDSKAIALRLEKDYPSPSMHMDSPILPEVEKIIPSINAALRGVWCPKIPPKLLNEPSRDYFVRTREQRFGIKFDNMAEMMGGEEAWMEALPGFKALGEILKKNGGPFVEGETGRSCTKSSPALHYCCILSLRYFGTGKYLPF